MDRHKGFTLVEVVVSMVVFALVIVGLSSVFMAGSKLIIHNRERTTSSQLGKFFLDPLQTHVSYDKWFDAGPGNGLAVGGPYPGTTQRINNRTFTEVHTVTTVGTTDLRRVITTIHWSEPQAS